MLDFCSASKVKSTRVVTRKGRTVAKFERKLWRGASGFVVTMVTIAVGCTELPIGDGGDDGGAGGEGDSGTAGRGNQSGSGNQGGSMPLGGRGGEGAEPEGGRGGSGDSGEAGSAGECGVGQAGSAGEGGAPAQATKHLCVAATDYCGPEACVQFSAGCVDHHCLPPLANDVTCSTNHQCESGRCDDATKKCVATGRCGCWADTDCAEGRVCRPSRSVDVCSPRRQCVEPGQAGVECFSTQECLPGLVCYATPMGTGITRCFGASGLGQTCSTIDPAFACGPGLDCTVTQVATFTGTCQTHGDACPCRQGFVCGAGNVCQALAQLGESCESTACDGNLRCAEVAE